MMDLSAMMALGAPKPGFEYELQWQFESENTPIPNKKVVPTLMEAFTMLMSLTSHSKPGDELVHVSVSRRNA